MERRCGMSIGVIYGKDSLTFLVTITDQETSGPLDLTGASLELAAKNGVTVVGGTAEVEGLAAEGQVACTFVKESFFGKPGAYTAHLRVAIGAEVQTVAVVLFTVESSIVVTP